MDSKPQNRSRQVIRNLYYHFAFWLVKKRIMGRGNIIKRHGSFLKNVVFNIRGDDNSVEIAPGVSLKNVTFYIKGNHHSVKIDEDCQFNRGGVIWIEDHHGRLEIGAGTTIEEVHIAITEPGSKVIIGKDCLLAYDIDIRTGDSHSLLDASSRKRLNSAQDVIISDHVWIAAHVIILKGVTLAMNSVVATGAIVVKSPQEAGVVIAGNPAKVVKREITWARERLQLLWEKRSIPPVRHPQDTA
jgi:acetyltransferase-like isoleucine patch superfamily enzyme